MRRLLAAALLAATLPAAATAQQEWGDLDTLLFGHLGAYGTTVSSFWLPDSADAARARQALGVVYEHVPGSASGIDISAGHFVNQGGQWVFAGPIADLYGFEPREIAFGAGHVELTTTMLGPGEARCCPTLATRWRIDLASRTARKLP